MEKFILECQKHLQVCAGYCHVVPKQQVLIPLMILYVACTFLNIVEYSFHSRSSCQGYIKKFM